MSERKAPADVVIRLLNLTDDLGALTAMLHRAYAGLAARGMQFVASHQSEAETRRRIAQGECWLAIVAGTVVGTVTLRDAEETRGSRWYDRPDVASFGQFCVEPAWQGRGIGSRLIERVEARASELGVSELAIDTAENAHDLIALYARRGYRFVEHVRWNAVNYRSVIMTKRIGDVSRSVWK